MDVITKRKQALIISSLVVHFSLQSNDTNENSKSLPPRIVKILHCCYEHTCSCFRRSKYFKWGDAGPPEGQLPATFLNRTECPSKRAFLSIANTTSLCRADKYQQIQAVAVFKLWQRHHDLITAIKKKKTHDQPTEVLNRSI